MNQSWKYRAFALLLAMVSAGFLDAQSAPPAPDPVAIVREAVANETRASENGTDTYRYTLVKETNSGNSVRELVETPQGDIARIIKWNGRDLTPEEVKKEDQKLTKLLSSPEEQRKKFQHQREDQEHSLRMVRALPDALLYEFDGTDYVRGRENFRFRFRSNPKFSSSDRETYAFRATQGKIWIDVAERRITRLDATITNDVNIGWGFLGHIDKGGKIFLDQTMVGDHHWRISTLNVDATGKALIFKPIHIKQHQTAYDFHPVGQLSVAQAVQLLQRG